MEKVIRAAKINGVSYVPTGAIERTPGNAVDNLNLAAEHNQTPSLDINDIEDKILLDTNVDADDAGLEDVIDTIQAKANHWEELAKQAEDKVKISESRLAKYEEELEQLRDHSRLKGYEEGLRQAEEISQNKSSDIIHQLNLVLQGFAQAKEHYLSSNEEAIIEVVLASVGKILGKELATRKGVVASIRQVLRQVSKKQNLIVHVAQDDFKLLESYRQQLFNGIAKNLPELVADDRIQIGGCIVEGESGSLDGRLEIQLQVLAETLLKVRTTKRQDSVES